jgi:hypothetical protein
MSTPRPKKRPKKQHNIRGASFIRLAKRLRYLIKEYADPMPVALLNDLAKVIEAEGKATSKLR